ncbi:unnamed protein product [Lactuca virosa]|uniref:Uncharacterized protein n=1 Tax=Lactuca virosa TaxID=75947 RepID=A0AAU9NQZ9_9ASTR|nr:unnamed protein product [Lactuca virosa]
MVAEEHVAPSKSNLSFSFEVSDDDDDVDFRMFVPSKEPINEVVISPAETEKEINIFKQPNDPTPEQMEALIEQLQLTSRRPPQAVPVTTESPYGSDKDDSNASLMPKKRRRRDPRPGVLITKPVQQPTSNVEPSRVIQDDQSPIIEPVAVHQDVQSPIFYEDFDFLANEETFASGSSSAPPPPEHDAASVKLAKLLAFQDSIPQSRGKGISIGSGHGGDEDSKQTISDWQFGCEIL